MIDIILKISETTFMLSLSFCIIKLCNFIIKNIEK